MIRLSLIPQLDPLILHNTRLVYVCVHFVQEESFPPCIKFIINHHIWWVCSVLQFPWGESRGNIDHIHSRTPLSINFRYLYLFLPHHFHTLTHLWLLVILSPTSYCTPHPAQHPSPSPRQIMSPTEQWWVSMAFPEGFLLIRHSCFSLSSFLEEEISPPSVGHPIKLEIISSFSF